MIEIRNIHDSLKKIVYYRDKSNLESIQENDLTEIKSVTLEVGEVSLALNRGKHTTRVVELFELFDEPDEEESKLSYMFWKLSSIFLKTSSLSLSPVFKFNLS